MEEKVWGRLRLRISYNLGIMTLMNTVSINLPDKAFPLFGTTADDLGRDILVAAVVKWFEIGKVSQGKAAEILGVSRSEFLDVLAAYRVSAWQYTEENLDEELGLD